MANNSELESNATPKEWVELAEEQYECAGRLPEAIETDLAGEYSESRWGQYAEVALREQYLLEGLSCHAALAVVERALKVLGPTATNAYRLVQHALALHYRELVEMQVPVPDICDADTGSCRRLIKDIYAAAEQAQ
ncbi:hypothetical protein H4R21_003643, partial [Coemansia helicoidea]